MNVLLVTDVYRPLCTSAANQIYDLAQAFAKAGHQVSIIIPTSKQSQPVIFTQQEGIELVRVKAWQTKDVNYLRRTFAEWINPIVMWYRLRTNQIFTARQYQGIIWYSPSIFWGPLIASLKKHFKSPSYLILRDIFPDWALDLGLIKPGLLYQFFMWAQHNQNCQANVIGLQSPNNLTYFRIRNSTLEAKLEVLWNWAEKIPESACTIDFSQTKLAGRKIFVYAGNMGLAQGMETLIEFVGVMKQDRRVGFAFVGRGSEVERLKKLVVSMNLDNALFFDEIDPSQIPGLYRQCFFGLITLDRRQSTHNIPGKFLSYLQAGLPVIAFVNPGNDLIDLIADHQLGQCFINEDLASISEQIEVIYKQYQADLGLAERCRQVNKQYFAASSACNLITKALQDLNFGKSSKELQP